MSKIKVNTIAPRSGSTVTLGESGDTIALGACASQTGFGRTGTVDWCTTAKTSPLTAVSGKGYFINTCGGAVTVTLPSSPTAGDIVSVADYASTFQNNALTLGRGGSKINSLCNDAQLSVKGQVATMVYVDGTRGWKQVGGSTANVSGTPTYIVACGGTMTTDGDYKVHTFTADGDFTICSAPTPANNEVSYLVVAGGGSGGTVRGGGGGAGGYREGKEPGDPRAPAASPLAAACSALPVSASPGTYTVTVGAGGPGNPGPGGSKVGTSGSQSIFSTITSAGGGAGAGNANGVNGLNGGSGGGSTDNASPASTGSGNTPPVSPPQGNPGGPFSAGGSAGGGGAGAAGGATPGPGGTPGGNGGAGATTSINGSAVQRAGGGAGGGNPSTAGSGTAGAGGGSQAGTPGSPGSPSANATANTGGGSGGSNDTGGSSTGNGGSGIVIIRYKFQ